jgi:sarcosine oxidase
MSVMDKVDVLVVGAGIMGAAVTWQLSRRGLRVALLEQYDLDHTRGSSHGASRIFRLAYEEPDYVRLAQTALSGWTELERLAGCELLLRTGAVDFGPPVHLEPIAEALHEASAGFDRVSNAESAVRFPAFRLPDGWETIFQADGGVLLARDCRDAFLDLARRAGARIVDNLRVVSLEDRGQRVKVTTDHSTWEADSVVAACAAWSNDLLEPLRLGVPLRTTREHVAYYAPRMPAFYLPFIWHGGSAAPEIYGLPNGRTETVKIGRHGAGPVTDPNEKGPVQARLLEDVHDFARAHLPGLDPKPVAAETCLYATTPDDDFVIDGRGSIVVAAGFGGHGFKFAPAVGEMVADLVAGNGEGPKERFLHARFGSTV